MFTASQVHLNLAAMKKQHFCQRAKTNFALDLWAKRGVSMNPISLSCLYRNEHFEVKKMWEIWRNVSRVYM